MMIIDLSVWRVGFGGSSLFLAYQSDWWLNCILLYIIFATLILLLVRFLVKISGKDCSLLGEPSVAKNILLFVIFLLNLRILNYWYYHYFFERLVVPIYVLKLVIIAPNNIHTYDNHNEDFAWVAGAEESIFFV